jgi:hypothetical protein
MRKRRCCRVSDIELTVVQDRFEVNGIRWTPFGVDEIEEALSRLLRHALYRLVYRRETWLCPFAEGRRVESDDREVFGNPNSELCSAGQKAGRVGVAIN